MNLLDAVTTYVLLLVWLESLARRTGNYRVALGCRLELVWLSQTFVIEEATR